MLRADHFDPLPPCARPASTTSRPVVEEDAARLAHSSPGDGSNPLFVVETLRALIDQGVLYAEEEGAGGCAPVRFPAARAANI